MQRGRESHETTGTTKAARVTQRRQALIDAGVALPVLAALGWGWLHRADPWFDPHGWPGYLLGLGGSLLMLAVLGFAWVKRTRAELGAVGAWYDAHIVLGLVGALAVTLHARFAWGSINSSFALAATLLVVISGLVARYALGPARRHGGRWSRAVVETWHYLHAPLYGVLAVAVIVHVIWAHAY